MPTAAKRTMRQLAGAIAGQWVALGIGLAACFLVLLATKQLGAEVRVFAAGTTRLLGLRLVDAGSGYDAQSDLPVHVAVPVGVARVDVQLVVPRGGKRVPVWQRGVALHARPGQAVTIRAAR